MKKSDTSIRKPVKVLGGWPMLIVCIVLVVALVILGFAGSNNIRRILIKVFLYCAMAVMWNLMSGYTGTTFCQRTEQAIRRRRCTLQSTKIHNCLIVECRVFFVKQFTGCYSKHFLSFGSIDRRIYSQPSGKNPIYISIHDGTRHIISKRTYRSSRILTYSLQRQHLFISNRKSTGFCHGLCRRMQIPGTRIIAQSLPILHDLIFFSRSQRKHIRKTTDKSHIIIISLGYTCLLKNNFRNPNMVRILCISPRKITFVLLIPP